MTTKKSTDKCTGSFYEEPAWKKRQRELKEEDKSLTEELPEVSSSGRYA